MSNLTKLINEGAYTLKQAGIDAPYREARLLLAHCLHLRYEDILSEQSIEDKINPDIIQQFNEFVSKRADAMPLSRIRGFKEFWGLDFIINDKVLDPRPDSEIMIETAIALFDKKSPLTIMDLGTGSGALLISLLCHFSNAKGVFVDCDEGALTIAKANATTHNLASRSEFHKGNWWPDDWSMGWQNKQNKIDLIISNPPYIQSSNITKLERNVRDYDPLLALDGGESGLREYHNISKILNLHKDWLKPNCHLLLEIGLGQETDVSKIFNTNGWQEMGQYQDLNGIIRLINFQLNSI